MVVKLILAALSLVAFATATGPFDTFAVTTTDKAQVCIPTPVPK
jgi:hypothetical protein